MRNGERADDAREGESRKGDDQVVLDALQHGGFGYLVIGDTYIRDDGLLESVLHLFAPRGKPVRRY